MSQFDDPSGAMPPPDENPPEPAPVSPPHRTRGPLGTPLREADVNPSPYGYGAPQPDPAPQAQSLASAPVPQGPIAQPGVTLDKRVVVYWILSGLISWGILSTFLGGAAAFVYHQTTGGGEDVSGWIQAWTYVLPTVVGLSGLLLAWTLISPPLAYARWRYSVDTDLLLARYGIFFIEEKAIPISRLQHVDLYRGFLERMFGLTTLIVFTAGTEGAHFRLPGLSLARARELRDLILAARGDDVI